METVTQAVRKYGYAEAARLAAAGRLDMNDAQPTELPPPPRPAVPDAARSAPPEVDPTDQSKWPKTARLLATLRREGERGLGDTAARCLRLIGAKSLAEAYTLLTGQSCGCADRQRKLNERFPYK